MLRVVVRDRSYQTAEVARAADRASLELALHEAALPAHPLGREWCGCRLERHTEDGWKIESKGANVRFVRRWWKRQPQQVAA